LVSCSSLSINDLPTRIADPSKPVLFADDTSIIITSPSPSKLIEDINNIIYNINDWFISNSLSLNLDKTYFLQFRPKNSYEINTKISCGNKLIKETKNTKFLGLDIDNSFSWKNHIDQMMLKLGRACYAIRYVKHFMSLDTLRTIYFSYFHSILWYGIIFWGNFAYSLNIFKIQKRIIWMIINATNRDSCRQLFKNLKILPLKSQYIFSLLLFVAKHRDLYESNSEIHNIDTRSSSDLYIPTANLSTFQKGLFYFGIKVFNHLPTNIKNTSHDINKSKSV
jgi:hypothetical protein